MMSYLAPLVKDFVIVLYGLGDVAQRGRESNIAYSFFFIPTSCALLPPLPSPRFVTPQSNAPL